MRAITAERGPERRVRRSASFEGAAWVFMRVSGLLLVVLLLGQLLATHATGQAERLDYAAIARRWRDPLMRFWDVSVILLALPHGLNGLRQIADEWVTHPARRLGLHITLWTVTLALVGLAAFAILGFREDTDYLRQIESARAPARATP